MHTVKSLKDEYPFPFVLVKWNGRKWWARISGRKNPQASVSPYYRAQEENVDRIIGPIFHFSWEAVTRAVNNGTELNCD
jgi:hypothetical protein